MIKSQKIFAWAFTLVMSITLNAQEIQMPALFGNGMVLQQQTSTPIWGWGKAGDSIYVVGSWNRTDTMRAKVNPLGEWETEIPTTVAGGPYSLQVINHYKGVEHTIDTVWLGEVWLCSGQSNMEWSFEQGVINGDADRANADYANLHIFRVPRQAAKTPQNDVRARWKVSSPESVFTSSCIGYYFGRAVSEQLNVPVGIISTAWGGTPAEVWVNADTIANDTLLANVRSDQWDYWPREPGEAYNQMIAPLIPFKIAGCLWYQGESNHQFAELYGHLMKLLINNWREEFNTQFPFYYVQIAPHTYMSERNTPALLREQQERVQYELENCGMISVPENIPNKRDIHPRDKRLAGERLAAMALERHYNKTWKPYLSPAFQSATFAGNKAIVTFKSLNGKLQVKGDKVEGVVASTGNGEWKEAKAVVKNNNLIVTLPKGEKIVAVRYCFDDDTIGNLYSGEMIPVLPFRTDNYNK